MGKNVIIACDFNSKEKLESFLSQIEGADSDFYCKVGMELFDSGALHGFNPVQMVKERGHKVFLDLKLKDIPNTVSKTAKVLAEAGADMINVHADGGLKMMQGVVQSINAELEGKEADKPILLGVTVLTSMSEDELRNEIGVNKTPMEQVASLARLCKEAGFDGVVCSPEEILAVKEACGQDFITVTPGIRFNDSTADDQKRVATPACANIMGSDFIVVGRPITEAENPIASYNRCKKDFTEEVTDKEEIENAKGYIENIRKKSQKLSGSSLPEYKQEFIEFAIKAGALKFGEFKLKSGRISPYFFNAGCFADGESISKLTDYYAGAIAQNITMSNVVLYGPAYKGIPLMTGAAVKLYDKYGISYPTAYNRKEAKDHGEGGLIVGTALTPEHNVVAIEDVVTAGTAIGETKEVLAASGGASLKAVVISLDRCEVKTEGDAKTTIQTISEQEGIQIIPIVTIYEILDYLYNRKIDGKVYIGENERQAIAGYLAKYGTADAS